MRHDEQGSITGFAVCIVLALVVCAGLVLDGGRMVAARIEAADIAENAARAGAQEVVGIQASDWRLDPAAAAARADRYLGEHGGGGSVSASTDAVVVTVERTTEMTLLRLVGVSSRTVTVTRSATAVDE